MKGPTNKAVIQYSSQVTRSQAVRYALLTLADVKETLTRTTLRQDGIKILFKSLYGPDVWNNLIM